MINLVVFLYSLLIFSAISLLISKSPLHSVLYLICLFILMSVLLIYLNISFLGLLILIVYVGAIAILFLYIVMMLNLKQISNNKHDKNTVWIFLGLLLFFITVLKISYVFINILVPNTSKYIFLNLDTVTFSNLYFTLDLSNQFNIIKQIGLILFSTFFLSVLCSGVLLLVSMVGAIILTNNKKGYSMRISYNFSYRTSNVYFIL